MSSALKPVLTATGSQNPTVPTQMNKPMHPQGPGTGPYGQQMPQNLMNIPHNNQNPAHNIAHSNPHQNHFALNIPNSFQGAPQASSHPVTSNHPITSNHPVASNHPIANQAHVQPVSYSPPKPPAFNQSYQLNSSIPATQNLPATQAQAALAAPATEAEKPQSNGTAEAKLNKSEQNHVTTPKKEVPQSPEKAKIAPEKPAVSASTSSDKPAEVVIKPIEPAEVPKNVDASTPATASTTTSLPSAPISAATSTKESTPPASAAPAPAATTTPTPVVPPTCSLPVPSANTQKIEPSVAATVESSTPASASSPTSTATTSTTVSAPVPEKPVETLATAEPSSAESEDNPEEPQEAESTTAEVPETTSKPKEQSTPTKSTMKVATTPRTPTRKSKTPKQEQDSPKTSKLAVEPKPSSSKSPGGGKVKRMRIPTQPYQSPIPELEIISKMTSTSTPRSKNTDEKLIIFYKNEFLAVRNSEGGFYICQAVQNVYKSSPKIKIRWLSIEKTGEAYTPDFYDYTDFDCILTNLNLERVDKGKYKLPQKEKERTDNILKRAIAVEKGEATSLDDSLTEDNPDGLDVSLYKDEEQLKKRKGTKRKAQSAPKTPTRTPSTRKIPQNAKVQKLTPKPVSTPKRVPPKKTPAPVEVKKTPPSAGRAERAKRRGGADTPVAAKTSPVIDQKKAKVIAKVAKRTAIVASPSPKPATPAKTSTTTKSTKQPVASTSKAKPSPSPVKAATTPPTRRTKRTKK